MSYRILSLDGGGIRGLFTARILQRLESAHPGLLDSIDLFAGTSTGGILALGLAAGFSPAQIEQFYLTNAARIFSASIFGAMVELRAPKYDNAGLHAALAEIFGTRRLPDLKRHVLVTTYDCAHRASIDMTPAMDISCVDAAMRTSAAETYFPAWQNCVDGGTAANNPAVAALAWAVTQGHPLSDLAILSVGTGNADRPPLHPDNWGALRWLENGLVDLFIDAPAQRNDGYCRELLGDRYCRVDGAVDCAMDETNDLIAKLMTPADRLDLGAAISFLGNH